MTEGQDPTRQVATIPTRTLTRTVVFASAIIGTVLMAMLILAWYLLPRFAPGFVVQHSPWLDPAFRAAAHCKDQSVLVALEERLPEWKDHAVPVLARYLSSTTDPERREAAAHLLGETGDPRAVPALLLVVQDPSLDRGQHDALESIKKIGDPEASAGLIEAIIKQTKDADLAYQIAGVTGRLSHPRLYDLLISSLLMESQPTYLQALGCLALSDTTDPRGFNLLEKHLGRTPWRLGKSTIDLAGTALGRSQHPEAIQVILRHLDDADIECRFAATIAASTHQHPDLLQPLMRLASDANPGIRRYVLFGLALYPDHSAVDVLGDRLGAESGDLGKAAVRSLARNKSSLAITRLIDHLDHPDPDVRLLLVLALEEKSTLTVDQVRQILTSLDAPANQALKEKMRLRGTLSRWESFAGRKPADP